MVYVRTIRGHDYTQYHEVIKIRFVVIFSRFILIRLSKSLPSAVMFELFCDLYVDMYLPFKYRNIPLKERPSLYVDYDSDEFNSNIIDFVSVSRL